MTVSYTSQVSNSRGFIKLLRRWKGSIYKLVWPDLLVYILLYFSLNFLHRFALNEKGKWYFKEIVEHCSRHLSLIPISFVLGFYVNIVMTRWWNQFCTIPYPDNFAILISSAVKGADEHSRMVRRTVVRYMCLTFTITMTLISPKIKKRFPTLSHLVESGLLTQEEKKILEEMEEQYVDYPHYWLPLSWASNIITESRHDGTIRTDLEIAKIHDELLQFKSKCEFLLKYDWISIPLVYTQVVTIAVYAYFLTSVMGRQILSNRGLEVYFPVLALAEFFFYMGWLRVAETLINPFGDDDDDFDVVYMVDRHIQVTLLIVDKMHEQHPRLVHDQFWADLAPEELPYTVASEKYRGDQPQSSTTNIGIDSAQNKIVYPKKRKRGKSTSSRISEQSSTGISKLYSREDSVFQDDSVFLLTEVKTDANVNKEKQASKSMDSLAMAREVIDFNKLKEFRRLMCEQKMTKRLELLRTYTNGVGDAKDEKKRSSKMEE